MVCLGARIPQKLGEIWQKIGQEQGLVHFQERLQDLCLGRGEQLLVAPLEELLDSSVLVLQMIN